jgi:hypothetical protein
MSLSREHAIAEEIMRSTKRFKWHKSDCATMLGRFYSLWKKITLPTYAYDSHCKTAPDEAYKDWEEIEKPETGCLVAIVQDGQFHIGIYLSGGDLLHMSETGPPVRIGKLLNFRKDIVGYYRYRL